MHKILFVILLAFTCSIASTVGYAAGPDDGLRGGGSEDCSWDEFLVVLGCQETGFVCPGAE